MGIALLREPLLPVAKPGLCSPLLGGLASARVAEGWFLLQLFFTRGKVLHTLPVCHCPWVVMKHFVVARGYGQCTNPSQVIDS